MSHHKQRNTPPSTYRELCSNRRMYFKDRRTNPYVEALWPQCAAVDAMSRDELLALQQQRLRDILDHVITHVPFYRDWAAQHGVESAAQIKFEDLPIATKRDYIAQPDAFLSDAYSRDQLRLNRTSGSAGEPFDHWTHGRTRDYSYCCLFRALWRHGVRPGDRRIHIWGQAHRFIFGPRRIKAAAGLMLRDWLNNTRMISAYDLAGTRVDEAIRTIERFNPVYIHAYVSAVHAIACGLLDAGRTIRAPRLRLVVCDSEKLHDFQRSAIARAFGCRVVEHYGSLEGGNIAQEDPAGRMRINEDYLIIEQSSEGEAIITHLLADAVPYIRYRLGDLIEFDETIAPGLPYRSIKSITGRAADALPVIKGGRVHGLAIGMALYGDDRSVRKYQIHQKAIDHFIIRVVMEKPLTDAARQRITRAIRDLAGEATNITIEEVADIPADKSGKFRLVTSEVTADNKSTSPQVHKSTYSGST